MINMNQTLNPQSYPFQTSEIIICISYVDTFLITEKDHLLIGEWRGLKTIEHFEKL